MSYQKWHSTLKNSKIESFSYYFSRFFSFYGDAKFLLVSRFSGFLEPEMQVLVVTYVAFMFSSSIFFPFSLKSLWQDSSQVADKLSGKFFSSRQNSIHMTTRTLMLLFGRCMKWEGFPS